MIKAKHDGTPSKGICPFMVVLRSSGLNLQELPDALPFQSIEVDDWEEADKKLSSFRPGCLLLDFDSGREQTIATVKRFADQGLQFSIVGITADRSRRTLHFALKHGFVDLVPRPIEPQGLIEAVQDAFESDASGAHSLCEIRSCFGKLTPREREILPHLLLGVPSRRLAGEFLVSYQTIDRHRKRVIEKMQVENMTELAMKLYRRY
jgi:FixJ family two-component response regulator